MKNNRLLYIGLNGLAGSGKDTVAKILNLILSSKFETIEECKEHFNLYYKNNSLRNVYATFNSNKDEKSKVMCIAFADQLKYICAAMFGIPVERFYNNKANSWVCINKGFEYTEVMPEVNVITADDFYSNIELYLNSDKNYWMSLRDILVYVGTYVCQSSINRNIFVNIVANSINRELQTNPNLSYVILTDVRFEHELDYIRKHNGITMTIVRDSVNQLANIAEHDLDEEDGYDFVIENNGTYDDLFETIWNLVYNEHETTFKNITQDLYTRDETDNYLRLISDDKEIANTWELCTPQHINTLDRIGGEIVMIDPVGGPRIKVGETIPGTELIPYSITFDELRNKYLIECDNMDDL